MNNNNTTVVNLADSDYDVYIGRPSKWMNPFVKGTDGSRSEVIQKFEQYIRSKPELLAQIEELRGKRLGCYCAPKACHGDVLVRLLEEKDRSELCEY